MPTMETIDYSKLLSLFKGEPGTRKSTAALSYPTPHYWLDWDKKMEALGLPMKQWNIDPKKINYDRFSRWDKGLVQLEKLQVNCPYLTLIADSLTSTGDSINLQTLKIKKGGGEGKTIAGIPVNSIEDFNAEDSALKTMVDILQDIKNHHKVHVILIAHVIQVDYKSLTGQTHISRSLVTAGKKVSAKIPAYFGEIYHFNIKGSFNVDDEGQYGLFTRHTGDDFARTSLPLPKEIIFNDKPLYDNWIKPAIDKMMVINKESPIVNSFNVVDSKAVNQ